MSDTDDTTTPTKKYLLVKKPPSDLLPKIPKAAAKTAPPHYVNKEEKKLHKWPQMLQYATIGAFYHNEVKDKYIASFNQLETMKFTFGSSPILDNSNHIVIGSNMSNALINQVAFSITKHNTEGTTTLLADITPNGEHQFIVHQPKGKANQSSITETPPRSSLKMEINSNSLKVEPSLPW